VTTSEGLVIIDPPMWPTHVRQWRKELAKMGEVRYLINTHHHIDHIAGNFFFPGPVIAHEGVRKVFSRSRVSSVRTSRAAAEASKAGLVGDFICQKSVRATQADLLENYRLKSWPSFPRTHFMLASSRLS
jgi:glyoxylase-like metal-dependent hydrolase (beta-lactamase superfamily II)